MALIRSFRDVPPGGWRYVQPETGVHFSSDTFDGLVAKVRPHREYKGLSNETLEVDDRDRVGPVHSAACGGSVCSTS